MLNIHNYMAVAPGIPASRDIRASLHIAQADFHKEQYHIKVQVVRGDEFMGSMVCGRSYEQIFTR